MKLYKAGIIGATGMVGQRFVSLLDGHPWFEPTVLAASSRSANRRYGDVMENRWTIPVKMPDYCKDMIVMDADADFDKIVSMVDFIFCAVDMKKEDIRALEDRYARAEIPVISNNSANRLTPDVPMIVPEINPEHSDVIAAQRKRLGTTRGFIAVKSNCSLQSYVPAIHPLMDFGVKKVLVCTYQAISGAGKTFATWPEMLDNVIPYIGGEEEKSEMEPLKLWGRVTDGKIVHASSPPITSQCLRVPVSDGHLAAVFVTFENKPTIEQIKERWQSFSGEAQQLSLPMAPRQFLHYFEESDRPQTRLDRDLERGMAISIGRLRPDTQYDYKFVCLSHNTLRGAAGGGVLMAELLAAKGYFD
jgi:aspartate-semialdehyde dehydrogenase